MLTRFALAALAVLLAVQAFALEEKGTLKGKVQDESGKDFPGVAVKASNIKSGATARAFAGNEGSYTFTLDPGEYSLGFDSAGYKSATLTVTYSVTSGKETRVRPVQMVKQEVYSMIKGAVFTEDGLSLPGARVVIERLDESGRPLREGREEKITNSAGSFAFRLPYASTQYRLTASMKGFKDATKEVPLDKGEARSISFRLQRVER